MKRYIKTMILTVFMTFQAWNEDGTLFVLGLNSGIVSVRFKVTLI